MLPVVYLKSIIIYMMQRLLLKNVLEAQGVYKKYYYDHQNPRGLFQLGDYVLMREVAIRKGKGHKLDRPMSGRYYITYKGQHESYKLREVGSNKLVPGMVHGRRLVKYNDSMNVQFWSTTVTTHYIRL